MDADNVIKSLDMPIVEHTDLYLSIVILFKLYDVALFMDFWQTIQTNIRYERTL